MSCQLKSLVALALATALSSSALTQWVPLTAKIRQTDVVSSQGKVVLDTTKEGRFYRSSNGSTLYVWSGVKDGKIREMSGELIDNQKLMLYVLNFEKMEAIEKLKLAQARQLTDPSKVKDWGLGENFIEGVKCRIVPIHLSPQQTVIGKACTAVDYGITLREDATWDDRSGETHHHTVDMSEIKLGIEPNPKLFEVEKRFTVFKPTHLGSGQ